MKKIILRVTYRYLLIWSVLLITETVFAQSVLINEVVSDNPGLLLDNDGSSPDWIELLNPGSQPVDLAGWFISDDLKVGQKWKFPSFVLAPGERKLVFASGKDRVPAVAVWNPVVIRGDNCKYVIGSAGISQAWRLNAFPDGTWLNGKTSVGFGDNDDATVVSQCSSVFLRIRFTVADTSAIKEALFFADYDDGFVAYLNGKEIARANMTVMAGSFPAWNAFSTTLHEAVIYQGGKPDRFSGAAIRKALIPGENVLAVEIHNSDAASSDLTISPYLLLGLKTAQSGLRSVPAECEIPSVEFHTNFSLSSKGETILLSRPDGSLADSVTLPSLFSGFSWARIPDGGSIWGLTGKTTPASVNPSTGFEGIGPPVQLTVYGGFYSSAVTLQLAAENPGFETRFTLDGSSPTENSPVFTSSVTLSKTTVVKLRTFHAGYFPGPVQTQTFFIADLHDIPVISISVDSNWFFQPDTGIYVMGPNASGGYPYFGANFWLDKEVPVNWEYFDQAGLPKTNWQAGLKIFGMYSRAQNQRSFALFARPEYGTSAFKFPFFDGNPVETFQSLVLRNSGNDWAYSGIRDHLTSELIEKLGVDRLQSKPVAVYLNGKYWGIYFLMEKTSENLISKRYQVSKESVEMIELGSGWGEYHPVVGSVESWNSFLDWMAGKDMNDAGVYAVIKARMDIQNFMSYQAVNIWVANTDWPGNNYKFFRTLFPLSPWKWLVYDTDFGYGLFQANAWQFNMIDFASTESGDPFWPNPPISTYLFRRLLENTEFKNGFINTCMDQMNTAFKTSNSLAVFTRITNSLNKEIPAHRLRWQSDMQGKWSDQIGSVQTFLSNRNPNMIVHLFQMIKRGGTSMVTLSTDSVQGTIQLNSILIKDKTWKGTYFSEIPISLTAQPRPGFKFIGWKGSVISSNPVIKVSPGSSFSAEAEFSPISSADTRILFNEINYNSAPGTNTGDWVEFLNPESFDADVSGWIFKDEDDAHSFVFPNGTVIPPGGFIVLAERPDTLLKKYSGIPVSSVPLSFGFNGSGELLRLFNPSGELMDSVRYSDKTPWPVEADGLGKTLEKIRPEAISGLPENWKAGSTGGTPGSVNSVLDAISSEPEVKYPQSFELLGNFPNPFNPSTTIQFFLPESGTVRLEVFDLTGKLIYGQERTAGISGYQTWIWNYDGAASGLFFYRLTWKGQSKTGKMILLK